MNNAKLTKVESIIRANAEYALDQRGEYASLDEALTLVYDNVRDSLIEEGLKEALEGDVFPMYRTAAQQVAKKLGISLVGTCCATI